MEIERKYLLKYVPADIRKCPHKEVLDIYIPKDHPHSPLRLRKNGDKYEMTKKFVDETDKSIRTEQTINLTKEEFEVLRKIDGKISHKIRYYYDHDNNVFEIDVYLGPLQGLILADVEFKNVADKDSIIMPDFCLADVTQDSFSPGGMLCGKSYEDIRPDVERYGYNPLKIQ